MTKNVAAVSASGSFPGRGGRNAVYVAGAVYLFGGGAVADSSQLTDGNSVYKLTITGTNPLTATYAWSAVTLHESSAAVTSENQWRGSWGKANAIADMGNGDALLILATLVNGPTYVMKIAA